MDEWIGERKRGWKRGGRTGERERSECARHIGREGGALGRERSDQTGLERGEGAHVITPNVLFASCVAIQSHTSLSSLQQ